ncbi:MAG: hypothetical protein CM1200mP41_18580 [Gammaproteobacteria bacterium]|nr:MAG: hypothetical protein CM1200mP41_18580 [Gammaproteobacteria bacterium]
MATLDCRDPGMHRTHHSVLVDERDANFGFNLAWWDYLFVTYRAAHERHTSRWPWGYRACARSVSVAISPQCWQCRFEKLTMTCLARSREPPPRLSGYPEFFLWPALSFLQAGRVRPFYRGGVDSLIGDRLSLSLRRWGFGVDA